MIRLSTPRLVIRPLRVADAPRIAALMGDPAVATMLADVSLPFGERAAREWLKPTLFDMRLGIERQGELIGGLAYHCYFGAVAGLGYWLGKDYWGQGYASEAAGALVRHGFTLDRVQRFYSGHFADNPASGRVLTRIGFAITGTSRHWCSARACHLESFEAVLTRQAAGHGPARSRLLGYLGFRPLGGSASTA